MIKTALIAALVLIAASQAFAQSARIATTIATQKHDPAYSLGRDFWFAPGQNYLDEQGKYLRIYITSPNKTTAYVASGGITRSITIPAYGIGTFNVPLSWEMKSSGIVEDKGIHVYDPTDDIAVYFMSHNPYTSDGMYCIPTIGWGTDYVVASYESLFEGFGSYVYDFPSEFTITADQDNTIVDITPSVDLRTADIYPQNNTVSAFPKGVKFEVTLMRGQCVQYQVVKAQDAFDYDVTGTIIHSNVPVGVVGASECPNIPVSFNYCDYITEMIPPVRTWGETYYTTNPIQPDSLPLHDSSMYLIISSKPNQEIFSYNINSGLQTVATLGPVYDHYFVEEGGANKWYSSAAFMLVQYFNSGSYPDNILGSGDPAQVVITPRENYPKTILTIAPSSVGSQEAYNNYANVIVNNNDTGNVTFDGKSITPYTHYAIDDTFSIYLVPSIPVGSHVVKSDSGVSVYLYGYGFDETFSWGGSSGVATFDSPDTIPPTLTANSECFDAYIHLADSGLLASSLSKIQVDSDINMAYLPDSYPFWLEGAGFDTSGYGMYVLDNTKPALLKVSVFDFAGNRTTITSVYIPQIAAIQPSLQNFGVGASNSPAVIKYDTLFNLGQVPFKFDSVSLLFGNKGFKIDSVDITDPIPVGGKRLIKISFLPVQSTLAVDSIIFGDECIHKSVALIGSGGAPEFFVSDVVWQNVPLHAIPANNWTMHEAIIHNLSKITIHVDTAGWTDRQHFVLVPGQKFPDTLTAYGTIGDIAGVWFYYEPTDTNRNAAQSSWKAPEVLESDGKTISVRYDSLTGNAVTPVLYFTGDTTATLDCQDTSVHSVHLAFVLANKGNGTGVISKVTMSDTIHFVNLTGHDQHGLSWDPTKQPENIPSDAIDTFTVDFQIKNPQSNMTGKTEITAVDAEGDTVGGVALTATVNVNYWSYSAAPSAITFGPVPFASGKVPETLIITNTSSSNLIINGLTYLDGTYNFAYSFTTVPPLTGFAPDTLPAGQIMQVYILFDPSVSRDSVQQAITIIESNSCNEQNVTLIGRVIPSSSVAEDIAPQPAASITQLEDGKSIHVTIPSGWPPPVRLDIYNILGESVYSSSFDATATFDLGELPHGVYFYRLREGEISQTGKIILGQ